MGSNKKRRHRHRVRSRTSRNLRTMLIVSGSVLLLIGVGAIAWGNWRQIPSIRVVGLVYVLLAVAVLATRQTMVAIAAERDAREVDDGVNDAQATADAVTGKTETSEGVGQ